MTLKCVSTLYTTTTPSIKLVFLNKSSHVTVLLVVVSTSILLALHLFRLRVQIGVRGVCGVHCDPILSPGDFLSLLGANKMW